MKNTKNTTVLKSNLKNRKNRHKMNTLTHVYMTAHIPRLVQTLTHVYMTAYIPSLVQTLTHVYMTAHIPRLVQKQNEYPNTRIYDSSHS